MPGFRRLSVCLIVLLSAACDFLRNPAEPTVPPNVVNYTAIGASDAIGVGGSSPCLPLIVCTSGTGYVQQVTQRLQATGKTVTLTNLGIPGAVLSPETEAIGDAIGGKVSSGPPLVSIDWSWSYSASWPNRSVRAAVTFALSCASLCTTMF